MESRWISLEQVARARKITLEEAAALADKEHWPKVFRTHGTVVLAPGSAVR